MAAAADTVSLPSHQKVEAGSVNVPIAAFPSPTDGPPADPTRAAADWVSHFNDKLSKHDVSGLANLFLPDGYWRDHLAVSWEFRCLKGREGIARFADGNRGKNDGKLRLREIKLDTGSAFRSPVVTDVGVQCVQAFLTLVTDTGSGRGLVRLVPHEGTFQAFTLFTALQALNDHAESVLGNRPNGVVHGSVNDRKNWLDRRIAESNFDQADPTVLIIGAGQSGLSVAARLKMLGVQSLIIDQEERVGDNWRSRYHQLVLHDPVWFDHLPYINFPPNWPIFTPKDKLGDFFESYVKMLELNVWVKTSVAESSWDEKAKQWTVSLKRQLDGSSETRTIKPRHIIQATGHSGKKNFPSHIKGLSQFAGDRLCHSSEFPGASPQGGAGKKAVVVGSCNSGHDIAQDFYEKGYDVTMVQRSSTCVVSSEAILKIGLAGLYEEGGPPVEDADMVFHGFPMPVFKGVQYALNTLENKFDADVLQGLEKAGFKCDSGPDDAGLMMKYLQRGGGYYIDVGTSQLIIDGKIKIKQGQEIDEVLPHGIRFQDGSELPADEIIFATGYQNMRSQARLIFGDEVADRVGNVWGFDEEGEMRSIWRKSGHPGFWFMGGNLALCRYYSRLLALQIKAVELGLDG